MVDLPMAGDQCSSRLCSSSVSTLLVDLAVAATDVVDLSMPQCMFAVEWALCKDGARSNPEP